MTTVSNDAEMVTVTTVDEKDSTLTARQPQMSAVKLNRGNEATNRESNPDCKTDASDPEEADPRGKEITDQEQKQKTKVPDGGYGWFVVLGCFISHVIIGSLERGEGVFFLEFQKRFGLSAQITAWPGALVSGLRLGFGPIATLVCNRYSVRSACIVGSFLTFLGLFLNGCAPNFYFLFLSHFLIQGVGRGLVYGPGLFLVGTYFDKRRGVATGLSTSGVGVGTFLLVPLQQLLFETYGYQGAFMLIAAIALNLSVCAMLYRPLSLHFKFTQVIEDKTTDETRKQEGPVLASDVEALDASRIQSLRADHNNNKQNIDFMESDDDGYKHNKQLDTNADIPSRRKEAGCLKSSLKIFFPIDTYNPSRGSKRKLFHFYLLKNPSFLFCCLSIMLFNAAIKSAFTFIPAQIKSLGNSESEAAIVLSITGAIDTVGRILMGFIFDLKCVKTFRFVFYTAFIFLIATISFILPMLEDYATICIVCGTYGFLVGGFISQKSVIIVDMLGTDNIANSFGLLICFQGVGTLIGPPVSGALKDATGTFQLAFDFGGALMLCAGCLMIISSIFLRRQSRKNNEEK